MTKPNLLSVQNLVVTFGGHHRVPLVRAVDDVSFEVGEGEIVAVIGESGSGKSTLAKAILGLVPVTSGTISYKDATIVGTRRRVSHHEIQVVFQDPHSSLNPTLTVERSVAEPLTANRQLPRGEVVRRVKEILAQVGLAGTITIGYPADFSGGQLQRIAIARALISEPRLVICDEPVSALDVSLQGQVLNLLTTFRNQQQIAYVLISHDIAVVRSIADRTIVLYRGRVMEAGPSQLVCGDPIHPYTRALVASTPLVDPAAQADRRAEWKSVHIAAMPQARADTGCPFAPRCPHAIDKCTMEPPQLKLQANGVEAACHRIGELAALTVGSATATAQLNGYPSDPQAAAQTVAGT